MVKNFAEISFVYPSLPDGVLKSLDKWMFNTHLPTFLYFGAPEQIGILHSPSSGEVKVRCFKCQKNEMFGVFQLSLFEGKMKYPAFFLCIFLLAYKFPNEDWFQLFHVVQS